MTSHADELTVTVFEAVKDGDPKTFESDFRATYLDAAAKYKPKLSKGQISGFFQTVRNRVKDRVERYRKRAPIPTTHQGTLNGGSPPKPAPAVKTGRKTTASTSAPVLHHDVRQGKLF